MPIIYEDILQTIPNQFKNIIYEQDFINSSIFKQYANLYYSNIIYEGLGSWIADKAKKVGTAIKNGASKVVDVTTKYTKKAIETGKKVVLATKQVVSNTLKNLADSASKTLSAGWDLVKKIGKAVWDGIKKLGEAVFGFAKKLYQIIKDGLKMLAGCKAGNKCGYDNPIDVPKDIEKAKKNVSEVLPFMQSTLNGAEKAGANSNTKDLEKTMAKGGNVNEKLQSTIKSTGQLTKNNMQSQLNSSAKSGVKQLNKDLEKTIPKKQLQQMHKDKDKYKPDPSIINDQLIEEQYNNILLQAQLRLKNWIIDLTYKGLTPKTIIESKYNQNFGKTQGNIIIGQSIFSFKTNNGYLICQQKTNNGIIIYQSNTLFKGNHLIYEQSEGKYIKPIIIEEKEQLNNIICEEIDWLNVMLWGSLVLGILLILAVITMLIATIMHAICPGSGFIANIADCFLNPFKGIGAAIAAGKAAFAAGATASGVASAAFTGAGGALGTAMTGMAAVGAAATVKSGYEMAKTGYDAKLGDGIDTGNTDEISKLKQEVMSGPSDEDLINSF